MGVHIFGVRHLSPGGAQHLLEVLDAVRPTAVLIEGPSDATPEILHLVNEATRPPVAILAYTSELPVRTAVWPLAVYSPEYQAMLWARRSGAEARFIDLPSPVMLALQEREIGETGKAEGGPEDLPGTPKAEGKPRDEAGNEAEHGLKPPAIVGGNEPGNTGFSLYETFAQLHGEPDYETYWERHFEHNLNPDAYRRAILAFSSGMRGLTEKTEHRERTGEHAVNAVREAYMAHCIQEAVRDGHRPDKIVVVCGAYHAAALTDPALAMKDEELKMLPVLGAKLTLMPYSYYRLSSLSGYGAGNEAPHYFDMMWEAMALGNLSHLPHRYMSAAAQHMREAGTHRSTAEVIEAVRLAEALASLHGGSLPALRDLRDAARTLLGHGELAPVAEALARLDIGTEIGELAEGVSQTPIQDDLARELKALKLEKYRSAVAGELTLDLRENRRASTEAAALLDLRRSRLLHRLELLDIGFAKLRPSGQDSASWKEEWILQWTPESEIRLVEATLLGETVELACAYALQRKLETSTSLGEASKRIAEACLCGLTAQMMAGMQTLQRLSSDSRDVVAIAAATGDLSAVMSYGSLRRIDTEPLGPLLEQLFLRGCLFLEEASGCNDEAASGMAAAIEELNAVAQRHSEGVDEALWVRSLGNLAMRDDRNPKLSGLACAILLERGELSAEEAGAEVSRRLSPGISPELGAGWFEGLAMRNRYALLSRLSLWEELDRYIAGLDEEQFRRALVFLRRAFSSFSPREKTMAAELLGEIWGVDGEQAAEAVTGELREDEHAMIEELNEFDFEDF
ncbi:hypothetical protein PDUR_14300 [Paenibacillus durus]|uniref:Uncharacterized protein n=1 Tax=Paenibacillus durus TaxID=44251 RepID=A0A089HPG5_PAEDU|nr:hypothetical protein PDUR_14300 [Paenibacillus durus]